MDFTTLTLYVKVVRKAPEIKFILIASKYTNVINNAILHPIIYRRSYSSLHVPHVLEIAIYSADSAVLFSDTLAIYFLYYYSLLPKLLQKMQYKKGHSIIYKQPRKKQ